MLRKIVFACFLTAVVATLFTSPGSAQRPSLPTEGNSSVSFQWIRVGFDSTQNRFRLGWIFENRSSESGTFTYRIISGCRDTLTGVMTLPSHLHRMGGAFLGCDSIAGIMITPLNAKQAAKRTP